MPDLTERERKILNKHTKSIINQLLKDPILQAKEMAGTAYAADQLKLFQRIFGIEKDVEQEYETQMEQKVKALKDDSSMRTELSF